MIAARPQVRQLQLLLVLRKLLTATESREQQLSSIVSLNVRRKGLGSLKAGDFAGLSALKYLYLQDNSLTSLPEDLFDGLSSLEEIDLSANSLTSLPHELFDGLSSLHRISLYLNQIATVPVRLLAGLSNLRSIFLGGNDLTSLPEGLFDGLPNLEILHLNRNQLVSLEEGIFDGLSSLTTLSLRNNQLTATLPNDVFAELTRLEKLDMDYAVASRIGVSLPVGLFRNLSNLEELYLKGNALTSLPEGVFADLSSLRVLNLVDNQLSELPNKAFVGLSSLEWLWLQENPGSPFPLTLTLERTDSMYRSAEGPASVVVRIVEGTPFEMSIDVEAAGGTLASDEVKIELGQAVSNELTVTASGSEPVSVSMSGTPSLPTTTCRRYSNRPSRPCIDGVTLKVEEPLILFGPPRPAQVTGIEVTAEIERIEVSWTAVSDASGYKVQWKASDEDYNDTSQAEIAEGDTTSYSIAGLMGGTEYTVRVLATKENADDGLPSSEVTGTPSARPASQVTGVEVTPGVGRLDVSWDALSDVNGYKVQWKSGDEIYEDTRQAVLIGGETVSHTITDLTAGTEYTVRVLSTKEHADDGPPSEEVTGIPNAMRPAQVTGVEITPGVEQLEVLWAEVSNAHGYKVQWKSGTEAYGDARQTSITGGDTVSYSITGLTAGTEYTFRVIATSEHAEDGSPSSEVTGTPKAQPPAQVTGLEVEPGPEQLEVSWTAVTDAGGYKVQWKSGTEAYGDARQTLITAAIRSTTRLPAWRSARSIRSASLQPRRTRTTARLQEGGDRHTAGNACVASAGR